MSLPPIDLDTESVQLDGHWYTRDALAQRIKAMLDSGDFAVSRPSQALEALTSTLSSLRTLAFRVTPEMADALNAVAARNGKSVGALIRDGLSSLLGLPVSEASPRDAEPPAVQPHAAEAAPVPPNLAPAGPITAGPGALKAAGVPSVVVEAASAEDAAQAVDLTSKKTKEEEAVERRWFGG